MTAGRLAGLAAGAIVILWGGILALAAIERRLPDAQQWYGHAAVHLWTAAIALAIACVGFSALRGHQASIGSLRWSVAAVVAVASVVTIANVLDAVGAYPPLQTFHDRVNAVAAPAGWVLLISLLVLVVVASATRRRASPVVSARGRRDYQHVGSEEPKMPQLIEASIEIDAPVETVWATVHDPAVYVEGIDWVREAWWEDDGPPGRGGVYAERAKAGLRESVYRWELTVFEPPRRAVHSTASGELRADLEVLVEPITDGRTRYTQRMHVRALPAFRPLGWLLERTAVGWKMQRDFERMILPNYKRIAERRAAI